MNVDNKAVRPNTHGLPGLLRSRKRSLFELFNSLISFLVIGILWEVTARVKIFPAMLFPDVETVLQAVWKLTLNLTIFQHIGYTLYRMGIGFLLAVIVGTAIGLLMGRFVVLERIFSPLLTVLLPIPSLAWLPLFILWFGIGNKPAIILVFFASSQYIVFNTWQGVRTMNPTWLRAANSLNITGLRLIRRIILPGALPMILTGYRLGVAQAWRAVVAGEMIAATSRGLGFLIFNSREFLQTDVMLASILIISVLGLLLEQYSFGLLERRTAVRWGTVNSTHDS